ncbi:hypothetical protein PR048_007065 [Dryococelus australis]|uniref:Uncharacterized protein n=1 Tax=Dryococelus australis TaxID=614101 RepID=A0ABQ9IEU3_9NEOP|nr:hypothetical protein PR048_007065 [Dryococelus australis]
MNSRNIRRIGTTYNMAVAGIQEWDGPPRPRSRSEGAIRATLTRTPSASSLLRARRKAGQCFRRDAIVVAGSVATCRFCLGGGGERDPETLNWSSRQQLATSDTFYTCAKTRGDAVRSRERTSGGRRPARLMISSGGRGGSVVGLPASHVGKPGSIPGGVAHVFSHVGIVPDDAAALRVSAGISRFPHYCISALLHTHLASPSLALKTSVLRAAEISSLTRATPECKGRGKREIPENTRRPAAWSGTIPTYESLEFLAGDLTRFAWVEVEQSNRSATGSPTDSNLVGHFTLDSLYLVFSVWLEVLRIFLLPRSAAGCHSSSLLGTTCHPDGDVGTHGGGRPSVASRHARELLCRLQTPLRLLCYAPREAATGTFTYAEAGLFSHLVRYAFPHA